MQPHTVADLLLRFETLTGQKAGKGKREVLQIESPNAAANTREELLTLVEAFQKAGKIGTITTSLNGERTYSIIAAVTEPGCIREDDLRAVETLGATAQLRKIR